ncbi:MAG: T9SS type A sorting domain-containing protein [Bacteroidales bacterium]|nr:T9SS type A sorting domain-containing protein [Bacteroidales bacterium]
MPFKLLYSKSINAKYLYANQNIIVELDSILTLANTFYVGYQIAYDDGDTISVNHSVYPPSDPYDVFRVFSSETGWETVTDAIAGGPSAVLDIQILATEDVIVDSNITSAPFSFSMFPNPNKHRRLSVWFLQAVNNKIDIGIYNVAGTMVYAHSEYVPSQELLIDLKNLSNGIYFINFSSEAGLHRTEKLILY